MIYFSLVRNGIDVFVAVRIDSSICRKDVLPENFRILSEIVTAACQFPTLRKAYFLRKCPGQSGDRQQMVFQCLFFSVSLANVSHCLVAQLFFSRKVLFSLYRFWCFIIPVFLCV